MTPRLYVRAAAMLAALLLSSGCRPEVAPAPALVLKRTIPLAGVSGRIDHLAFDTATNRLFIAALGNGTLEVVDLEKGERVKSIAGLKEPQGVAVVPASRQIVVACGGDGTVRAFDLATLEAKTTTQVGDDADNVRLTADGTTVLVGYGDGGLALLPAKTLEKPAAIALDGHPESFQLDPTSQRVFVNVPGSKQGPAVVVCDRAERKILATWKLADAASNYPLAFDAAAKRLFVGCRRPARLLVLDSETGAQVTSVECTADADDIFVDAKTGRVLVIAGGGAIDVFETKDQRTWSRLIVQQTADGARTGLLVPERRVLYVAVPARGDRSAEIREYQVPE